MVDVVLDGIEEFDFGLGFGVRISWIWKGCWCSRPRVIWGACGGAWQGWGFPVPVLVLGGGFDRCGGLSWVWASKREGLA